MVYPKIFKNIALATPVFGEVVGERDGLRSKYGSLLTEYDLLSHRFAQVSSECDRFSIEIATVKSDRDRFISDCDRLNIQIAAVISERNRLNSENFTISAERDQLQKELAALAAALDLLRNDLMLASQERDRLKQIVDYHDSRKNVGYCHCCRQESVFQMRGEWLRDLYVCLNCSSIPRQRHLQYVLDSYFKNWEDRDIHESSPSNNFVSRYCNNYTSSQYFDGSEAGSYVEGIRSENLESLSFPNNSFDLFITQDVFEHIFNPERAAREIMRVLRPGGAHVFTVPKHKGISNSFPRARLVNSQIEYLMEAVYHGNPIGDGKALVTWDYGDDFESMMNRWTRCSTTNYITRDNALGIDGEFIDVFVTRKNFLNTPSRGKKIQNRTSLSSSRKQ